MWGSLGRDGVEGKIGRQVGAETYRWTEITLGGWY